MPTVDLKIEQLVLDSDNPRITHAAGQQEAFQKVVKDQKMKLVRLAESIVEHGLSPIERLMVLEVSAKPKRYIALEGNRRVATLKLLANPAAMTGLDMPDSMQRSMERLAAIFDVSKIEPISAYEVGAREEGKYWIELRHNGEDEGRGVVGWKPIVAARFRKREPAIQALDLVLEHGGFNEEETEAIRSKFSLTTLRRVVEDKTALALLGLTVKDNQLRTNIPGAELMKPLRKVVRDIAAKAVNSRTFNKSEDIVKYVRGFGKSDSADATKKIAERPVEGISKAEFTAKTPKPAKPRPKPAVDWPYVVPKGCSLTVTDNRIGEIYKELQTLKLSDARNAIAVLLRVFLELSVDHFLEDNGIDLHHSADPKSGKKPWKSLDKKLAETVDLLIKVGVPKAHFAAVTRSVSDKSSPMHMDLFHRYVHDRFQTPVTTDLAAAWNNAQPLFEKIWP
ncbi:MULTISPECIES: hypothetical protein [unclassified Mesorhizobium]|uniref:hypothetical protein n=1 Tax=unclassified Mesorhizobium TaxID=325217 RepID=UPI0003D020EE|nr:MULTISPECIES: hypothetical protein [unclassified Mesorhizobium]ESZ05388.1 hypothetical protein X736_18980 [Mesorhizobium sp. L2C089B000]WJI49450.1 hypothetical protein NLY44_22820 [Mesorhizobium sp. C089B]